MRFFGPFFGLYPVRGYSAQNGFSEKVFMYSELDTKMGIISKAAIFVAVAAAVQFLVPPFAANVHSTAALAMFGARDPGSALVGKVVFTQKSCRNMFSP